MIHNIRTCACWDCETSYLRIEAAEAESGGPEDFGTVIGEYIAELQREGVPLSARLTVAAVLADLCTLAGIPEPLIVSTALREA